MVHRNLFLRCGFQKCDPKLELLSETEILEGWESRFDDIFFQNLDFLKENVNNQEIYNSKISALIKELDFIENTDSTQNETKNDEGIL